MKPKLHEKPESDLLLTIYYILVVHQRYLQYFHAYLLQFVLLHSLIRNPHPLHELSRGGGVFTDTTR